MFMYSLLNRRDQLAPISTPQLRARLMHVFQVPTDPDVVDREGVLDMLLEKYALQGPRQVCINHTPFPHYCFMHLFCFMSLVFNILIFSSSNVLFHFYILLYDRYIWLMERQLILL